MTIKYNVSHNGLRIDTHPEGILNVKSTIDYFQQLTRDELIKTGAVEIVYLNKVTDFRLSYLESNLITKSYQQPKAKKMIDSTIFVCESDLAYGMGRMLQTLHEVTNPDHRVHIVRSQSELENLLEEILPDN